MYGTGMALKKKILQLATNQINQNEQYQEMPLV